MLLELKNAFLYLDIGIFLFFLKVELFLMFTCIVDPLRFVSTIRY